MADRILFLETPDIPKTPVGEEPTIPTVPTKVSELTNDSGYQTAAQVQTAIAAIPDELPSVSASDNGKVLGVVNGAWAAKTDEGGGSAENAVLYTAQSLTDAQKTQARTNVGAGTYSKPSGGIPASDLAQAVQTSLGKADSALQQHQSLAGYATETWVQNRGYQTASDVQTAIEETVMVVQLTPTSTDLSGTMNKTGSEILTAYSAGKRIVAEVVGLDGCFEWNQATNGSMVTQFLYGSGSNRELIQVVAGSGSSTAYYAYHIAQLPSVTASDNGKFLRVVSGAWAAETVRTWQGGSY